jgi:hypothetical protein
MCQSTGLSRRTFMDAAGAAVIRNSLAAALAGTLLAGAVPASGHSAPVDRQVEPLAGTWRTW